MPEGSKVAESGMLHNAYATVRCPGKRVPLPEGQFSSACVGVSPRGGVGGFFDDFPMASHSAVACSTQATVRALLSLTGFEFAEDKCPPFHSEVVLDVSESAQGIITLKNKQGRVDELKPILDDVLNTGKVVPCELPSFIGLFAIRRRPGLGKGRSRGPQGP